MSKNNDFIQIGIDYSGADEDKHCAILNLYYNDTAHLIYETFDKEQIKALDNVLQNTFEQQRKVMALEVIKNKTVDIWLIQNKKTLKEYNSMVDESRQLTEEEFNLLKEILE